MKRNFKHITVSIEDSHLQAIESIKNKYHFTTRSGALAFMISDYVMRIEKEEKKREGYNLGMFR